MSSHRQVQQSRVEVWNSIKPAKDYVPGLGRGAQGFTTRSDIGPARFTPAVAQNEKGGDGGDDGAAEAQAFDHFMGNDAGAFAFGDYDEDDREADQIWEKIDETMDERRKRQREAREKEEWERFRADNPLIKEQFADLKSQLAKVSEDEWKGIPEIGDYTIKKQKRFETFSANSDSMLAGALSATRAEATEQTGGGASTLGGFSTDLTALGQGRKQMLGVNLDRMADSITGQSVVDPTGYLTSMSAIKVNSDVEVSDIKKARTLMRSMVTTNPKQANGWIAFARLEEIAGNLKTARTLIQQGTENCPTSEDVWLEAARLQTPENARALLARGVAVLPTSIKLWMQATRMETDVAAKRRVLRKALERNPKSVRLWKAAVELHDEDDARLLLSRAVECCPDQADLWIALVRLETYDNAKKVLNKAVKALPTEPIIWITAAKLEESQGNARMVHKVVERAIKKSLPAAGVIIDRETWIKDAETCEKSHPPMLETCKAIIKSVIAMGVEEVEQKETWQRDAEECLRRGSVETARAILQHTLEVYPTSRGTWRAAADLEKAHGTPESLEEVLRSAVTACPTTEVFWLMAAKEKWLAGDVPAARQILQEAYTMNPDSEEILLAAFKLLFESRQAEDAREILEKARAGIATSTARVWMKSAIVARELGREEEERKLLVEGILRFPKCDKLHMMLGQLEARQRHVDEARAAYRIGLKANPGSIALWKLLAGLEEHAGDIAKARSALEQGRLRNPKCPELWLAAVRMEARSGKAADADVILARALQDCEGAEGAGILWAECILTAPRPLRKGKMADALKRLSDDPFVFAAIAQIFAQDRKHDLARRYFERSTKLDSDIGDTWALWYRLESVHGTPEAAAAVLEAMKKADPHHGERWCRVTKDIANAHQPLEVLLKRTIVDFDTLPPP